MKTQYITGDKVIWQRADGRVRATILAILAPAANGNQRARLAVEGWAGTDVQELSEAHFTLAPAKARKAA